MLKMIEYKGKMIQVRGGAWLDIMNSCFYDVIDKIPGYSICYERGTKDTIFALPRIDCM